FSSCAEGRKDDLNRRHAFGGMDANRNPAPIVDDGYAVIVVDLDEDAVAITGQSFIDRVIDDFINQMMQPARIGRSDVHPRTRADVLDIVEHADLTFIVIARGTALGGI